MHVILWRAKENDSLFNAQDTMLEKRNVKNRMDFKTL